MSDSLLREELQSILEALERIPRRFADIRRPKDFTHSAEGMDRLDAICMVLIAVGEAFRKIDRRTEGSFLARYPEIDWPGIKGVRDVMAHAYFDVDAEQVFKICQSDVPVLIGTVRTMIRELGKEEPGNP